MRQVIKSWAESDFRSDPELNLIPSLYMKLRLEGYDFSNLNENPPKSAAKLTALKDPNVVSSQQEEDDIAKAIELSLKETKNSPKIQSSSNAGAAASASTNAASAYVCSKTMKYSYKLNIKQILNYQFCSPHCIRHFRVLVRWRALLLPVAPQIIPPIRSPSHVKYAPCMISRQPKKMS